MNRVPLTEQQFRLITVPQNWRPVEIPLSTWFHLPRIVRPYDTVAVLGSGCENAPRYLNCILGIAGVDVLVLERNRKTGEPEGNAYHCVFQQTGHPGFPYLMHGFFRSETRVPHWFAAEDLDIYWSSRALEG